MEWEKIPDDGGGSAGVRHQHRRGVLHLDNHGNLNGLGKGLHHTFRPVVACGVPFRSISRFAAFIGRSTSRVHYRLNAGDQDWIDRQYEAARRRVPG